MSNENTCVPANDLAVRELVLERTINAPIEKVFKAFTDPKQLSQWFSPKQFTNPRCEVDLQVGGSRRIVMRSPTGEELLLEGTFREIVENKRIVVSDSLAKHPPEWHAMVNQHRPNAKGNLPDLLCTITFEDHKGQTKLTILYEFETAEDRNALVNCGMIDGWTQTLDKLEELLASN
jgi:uncharacterized protein YndB with AHSA1/START domain